MSADEKKLAEIRRVHEVVREGFAGVLPGGRIVDRREHPEAVPMQQNTMLGVPASKPVCPKKHRFRPVSFNEETGEAVYACKCGIEWKRQAKFMCEVKGAE